MRNAIDFTSWEGLLSTLLGLAVFSLVVVGIRLLIMHIVQLRRERENRQINERLHFIGRTRNTLGVRLRVRSAQKPVRQEKRRVTAMMIGAARVRIRAARHSRN